MGNDPKGQKRKEPVAAMRLSVMQTPAWRALSATAQSLYVWIKLEWSGPQYDKNGKLRLSVRQAAERMGCAHDTAAKGFRELQAKGFIIQTEAACLGTQGMGKAPAYELTEVVNGGGRGPGKQWFMNWSEGHDFPVRKGISRAKQKTKPCPKNQDGTVLEFRTKT